MAMRSVPAIFLLLWVLAAGCGPTVDASQKAAERQAKEEQDQFEAKDPLVGSWAVFNEKKERIGTLDIPEPYHFTRKTPAKDNPKVVVYLEGIYVVQNRVIQITVEKVRVEGGNKVEESRLRQQAANLVDVTTEGDLKWITKTEFQIIDSTGTVDTYKRLEAQPANKDATGKVKSK
jgi:hypothetical protein